MSLTRHTLRFVARHTSVPVTLCTAAVALACATAYAAEPAAPKEGDTGGIRSDDGKLTCATPQYPVADIEAGHQGTVVLAFLIDPTGRVGDSKVLESSGFASLDEAARTTMATCRFDPPLEDGKPVRRWTIVKYVWSVD